MVIPGLLVSSSTFKASNSGLSFYITCPWSPVLPYPFTSTLPWDCILSAQIMNNLVSSHAIVQNLIPPKYYELMT